MTDEKPVKDQPVEQFSNGENPITSTIAVKVYSPFRVYYDNDATSVSAENGTGLFDILGGHRNFLSILKPCTVKVRSPRGDESFPVERGVVHVRNNTVRVFLDV